MTRRHERPAEPPQLTTVVGCGLGQFVIGSLWWLFVLEQQSLATIFLSTPTWIKFLERLGGSVRQTTQGPEPLASLAGIGLWTLLLFVLTNMLTAWRSGSGTSSPLSQRFQQAIVRNTLSLTPVAAWTVLWIAGLLLHSAALSTLLQLTLDIAVSLTMAMWMLTLFAQTNQNSLETTSAPATSRNWLIAAIGISTLIFTAMNWGLWFSLRIPHGDSAMYEEHLWNLLHGKGFRSYLDQGLFLGEHIQVIHLGLIPLYLLWPSHLLLELCESLALASGAIPVYLMARRHSHSSTAALWLSVAYLLYFPLHYLDIAIDLKTFRPISFGVPLMLWTIDALERKRWGGMFALAILSLAAKEDFAIVLAPLGLWLFLTSWFDKSRSSDATKSRTAIWVGSLLCIASTLYLLFVVKIAIPWFRDWETVHYARYFSEFGETPTDIVVNMVTRPHVLFSKFVTAGSFVLLLHLLMPIGFPLRAWSRLLVGLPLFLLLCLNELTQQTPGPVHHFHAPLLPILWWASCASLLTRSTQADENASEEIAVRSSQRARWVLCCALASCLIFSFGPLSLRFWDSGRAAYWGSRYVPDARAAEFSKIESLLPQSARVASTDYVHPRFTHYERSYDYSNYLRKVSDYLPKVPDDTDFIVIDTRHPYSEIHSPPEVRELQESPEQWELLPDQTDGYFIVLMRKGIKFDGWQPPEPAPSE